MKRNSCTAIFLTVALVIMLTLLDVFVIVHLWLPNRTTSFGSQHPWFWWIPFWAMQFLLPLTLAMLLRNNIPLFSYILFFFGVEDKLFYLFWLRRIPEKYVGIWLLGFIWEPTRDVMLVINLTGLIIIFLMGVALRKVSIRIKPSKESM